MINKSNIYSFFIDECEASKKRMVELYALDLEERINKRKAIDHVTVDPDYKESKLGYNIRKVYAPKNISDFKIGEYLVIHRGSPMLYDSSCNLFDILDDGSLLLAFDNFGSVGKIDRMVAENRNQEFILDKNSVDMTRIYETGFTTIKQEHLDIVNKIPSPRMAQNRDEIIAEIRDTEKNFDIHLTDNQREAIANAMLSEDYYLIQGPPGTGKSFVIAILLIELLVYKKERVAISGPNHMAINNVLSKLCNVYNAVSGVTLKIGQAFNTTGLCYYDKEEQNVKPITNYERIGDISTINNWQHDLVGIVAGCTPFHMHTSRAGGLKVDTLIIDEAGQMNVGLALMAMSCAKRVIFVGDHKQMSPIFSSEEHPEELKRSIFEHLFRDYNSTTLNTSFRMNAPICNLISEAFYDGALKSANPDKRLSINSVSTSSIFNPNTPIVIKDIDHMGTNSSEEEADFCVSAIKECITQCGVKASDIAVIAPFRAQCALIRKKLRKCKEVLPNYADIIVDTVDRMQGQEAEVIFISLTAGDTEYISELTNFIFNPNRFNVALSRAKNKLIIVGNIEAIKAGVNETNCSWLSNLLCSEYITKAEL